LIFSYAFVLENSEIGFVGESYYFLNIGKKVGWAWVGDDFCLNAG